MKPMNRIEAVNQLAQKALLDLSPEERDEQLEIMMLEAWDNSSEWKNLKWGIRREFKKQELKSAATDKRYDDVLLIWLRAKFNAYSNEYLSQQLSSQEIIGTEPELIPCPCCGYRTIGERAVYEICPICWWEDDGQDNMDADIVMGGPNDNVSLTQARANFLKFGIYNPNRTDLIEQKDDPSKYIKARKFEINSDGKIIEVSANWSSYLE